MSSPNAVAANLKHSEGGRSGSIGRFTGVTLDGRAYNAAPLSLTVKRIVPLALEKHYRYEELKNKRQTGRATPEELKEYQTLSRVRDLTLDFERSHRYMMNREKYSQQDVDYAFSLEKKERQGDFSSDIFEQNWNDPTMATMKNPNASASATYQMLIMKGVFGGMKDRFTKKFDKGYEPKDMPGWINDDILDCIRNHGEEMATIIRGMMHAADKPDKRRLQSDFSSLLTRWIFELFHGEMDVNQYRKMIKTLMRRSGEIMKEVDKVITGVMGEDQPEKFPDSE